MKTMHLLESGNFLLGIESSSVLATLTPRQFQQKNQDGSYRLLPPAGLFLHNAHKTTGTESVIVQISKDTDHPFLLFDRDLATVQGEPVQVFPELYPEKASFCCPEALIHNDEVVLCLAPDSFYELFSDLSAPEKILVKIEDLFNKTQQTPKKEETKQSVESSSTEDLQETKNPKPAQPTAEKNNGPPKTISVDPVTQIIAWIAGEFKKQALKGKVAIGVGNIPVALYKNSNLDDAALQNIISQTLARLSSRAKQGSKNGSNR